MLIGELSTRTGASARSLRHYESLGLLRAIRTENGYRRYSDESVERVNAIRFLLASGITTPTIAQILPAMMYQHCKLADPKVRSAIEREAARIKSQIEHLTRSHSVLADALQKGHLRRPVKN
jgi:DNA-binding transcriptional MerR regulator